MANAKQQKNPVQVYCRVRPLHHSNRNACSAFIKDSTTVVVRPQEGPLQQKQNESHETHFVFKKVFDAFATQIDVFKIVAEPLVERLVSGQNSLLFTYGVTNSGKTYTMTGDAHQCGIMPRCLDTLFRTIAGHHAKRCTFQPDHLNGFEIIAEAEAEMMLLSKGPISRQAILKRKNSEPEFNLNNLGLSMPVSGLNEHNMYAVFITYVEIYNNSVYDLLEDNAVGQKSLQSRIVREDGNHNMYVHGATEIEICSVQEALEAFQMGQKRKRMAYTFLNAESSRSHSVFSIRLVQAPIIRNAQNGKSHITISQLSLVDLAGSERSSRTKNTGARLREAGNINNSLMTLRTCLEYLKENQQTLPFNTFKKIPYRDSKITLLFKNFFEGEGQVSMIVCINPRLEDYAENAQVLKFAEMTQEVFLYNTRPVFFKSTVVPQLGNKENTIPNIKASGAPEESKESDSTKKSDTEALKKFEMLRQQLESRKELSANLNRQMDLCRKRNLELEKQNSELRAELEAIRKAYKTATGRTWTKGCVVPTFARNIQPINRPLNVRQKGNAAVLERGKGREVIYKQASITGFSKRMDFENELKVKLQRQLSKIEKNSVEIDPELRLGRRSRSLDVISRNSGETYIVPTAIQSEDRIKSLSCLGTNLQCDTFDVAIQTVNPQKEMMPQNQEATKEVATNTVNEASQVDEVHPNIPQLMKEDTPRPRLSLHSLRDSQRTICQNCSNSSLFQIEVSTPVSCSLSRAISNSTRSRRIFLTTDPEFEKREQELTVKLEEHRKMLSADKRLVEILQSVDRTKRSKSLLNKLGRKVSLKACRNLQHSLSDDEELKVHSKTSLGYS